MPGEVLSNFLYQSYIYEPLSFLSVLNLHNYTSIVVFIRCLKSFRN